MGSWSEASPGDLAHTPSEAAASTLGHILGCLQRLLACLQPRDQAQLCASFCPKLAQHLPAGMPAGQCSPAVRGALQALNLAYLHFSLQAAEAVLARQQVGDVSVGNATHRRSQYFQQCCTPAQEPPSKPRD